MKPRFVPDFSADMFAAVEGVCDTPLRFLADKEKGV